MLVPEWNVFVVIAGRGDSAADGKVEPSALALHTNVVGPLTERAAEELSRNLPNLYVRNQLFTLRATPFPTGRQMDDGNLPQA